MANFNLRITNLHGTAIEFRGPADITLETTDAIVNAANSSLLGGGGVDGAIHRAGGPSILEECRCYVAENGHLPAGSAMLTNGGRLVSKYVIHTVGPIYRGGENQEHEILASCYGTSISLADEHAIKSLAFPSISTGAYGYPVHDAASVAVASVIESLERARHLRHVRFVLFDLSTARAYVKAAEIVTRNLSHYTVERAPDDFL